MMYKYSRGTEDEQLQQGVYLYEVIYMLSPGRSLGCMLYHVILNLQTRNRPHRGYDSIAEGGFSRGWLDGRLDTDHVAPNAS